MAGRPRALTSIVPESELLDVDSMRQEDWDIEKLILEILTAEKALQWLARNRLLKNTATCQHCKELCSLQNHTQNIDGKRWCCVRCHSTVSVRQNSFFSSSHLSLKQIIKFVYFRCNDLPLYQCAYEAKMGEFHGATDWANFCREECEIYLTRQSAPLGGFDELGYPLIVEIDELKYFHRKYHQGLWKEDHWVFRAVERRSEKCVLVEMPDRTSQALQAVIVEYILPGSHMVSDGWAAYGNLERVKNGIYLHSAEPYNEDFVNPHDSDIHTLRTENVWMQTKRKLRNQFSSNPELFHLHLHELLFRHSCPQRRLFQEFIVALSENYAR